MKRVVLGDEKVRVSTEMRLSSIVQLMAKLWSVSSRNEAL